MQYILLAAMAALPAETKRAGAPADAVALALQDVSQAGAEACFYRYVWVPSNTPEDAQAVDFAVATSVSKASTLLRGERLGEHRLLRYDLRMLAPREGDLKTLTENWEKFAQDEPYFLVTVTTEVADLQKDVIVITSGTAKVVTAKSVLGQVEQGAEFDLVGETADGNGEWFEITYKGQRASIERKHAKKETRTVEKGKSNVLRQMGVHVGDEAASLVTACQTQVPIVRADYFIRKVISTLDGGLYYEFRGIVPSPDENLSDLDHTLRTFAGVEIKAVEDLGSDQKAVIFQSKVTAKPRITLFLTGIQSRITVNQGLVVLTQDMRDGDLDPKADPIQNLLRHKFAGIEAFIEMPNGMIAYALFAGDLNGDGKYDPKAGEGKLVRSVPDDIATDHSVPAPHTGRLQPAISCIRCHNTQRGTQKPEGWIEHPNDVLTLLKSGLDVFGERTDGVPKQETIDRAGGLYTGDLGKPFTRARDDLAEAVFRLTGNPGTDTDSGLTLTMAQVTKLHDVYWYDLVTPQMACLELGFTTTPEQATATLIELLPPVQPDELGVSGEDVRIGALKAGLSINRFQWDAVYGDAAARALHTLIEEHKEN